VPKFKTHSSAKKRYKITGTGKVMRQQAERQHYFEGKSSTRTRRLAKEAQLSPGDTKRANRLLGR
jgi:large subunit ribosomal protein L35